MTESEHNGSHDLLRLEGIDRISGIVPISGFKHAAVSLIAASCLVSGETVIDNVPRIADTMMLANILRRLGATVEWSDNRLAIEASTISTADVPKEYSEKIHGALYLLPGLLMRTGRARLGRCGGCQIGSRAHSGERPVDHLVTVLEAFGARFYSTPGLLDSSCDGFRATEIDIRRFSEARDVITGPRVSGATKMALLAAAAAHGTSVIHHPYRKPDVTELLSFLRDSGFGVHDEVTRIAVQGGGGTAREVHVLVSDVVEIVTFIACSVLFRQPLFLKGVTGGRARSGMAAEEHILTDMGVALRWTECGVHVCPPQQCRAINIEVTSQSIFSDSQPLFAAMLLTADGDSTITERVWEDRFEYSRELIKLGADLDLCGRTLRISPSTLRGNGCTLYATELRGAAAMVLAAMKASGTTFVKGCSHLDRGYEDLPGKLRAIGARISPGHSREGYVSE